MSLGSVVRFIPKHNLSILPSNAIIVGGRLPKRLRGRGLVKVLFDKKWIMSANGKYEKLFRGI